MRAAVAWFSQKLMLGLASTLEINIVNELRVLLTPAHPLQGAVSQFEWVTLYPDNPQKVNKRFGVAWHSKLAMVSWRNYTKVPWSFHLCSHHFNQIAVEIHLQKLTMKPPETPSSSHAKTIDGHTFFSIPLLGFCDYVPSTVHWCSHTRGFQANTNMKQIATTPDAHSLDLQNKSQSAHYQRLLHGGTQHNL